jgi:pilus assembly protein Flp/PilA
MDRMLMSGGGAGVADPGRAAASKKEMQELSEMLKTWAAFLWRDEAGASLVEYILLVALVAVVSIGAITFLGTSAREKFQFTANSLNGAS